MSTAKLPALVEEITPAWISHALQQRFPGAKVTAAEMTQFIGGTAQKCRFALTYDPAGPAGPPSLWVKGGFDPSGPDQGDAFANETRFYRDLAPLLDLELPEAFFGAVDPSNNNGVLVLEDLILRDATFGRATSPLSADMAAKVLTQQARLHARFWGARDTAEFSWLKPGGSIAGSGMVDQYFGLWDGAQAYPRMVFLTAEQKVRENGQGALNALMKHLAGHPLTVLHGDSQGGNLYFVNGQPGYLDWQHSMIGHWGFDLGGFMSTSLTVEERRANERDLLAHYLAELAANGAPAPSFADAWEDYGRYVMWGFMWVMCPTSAHPEEVCSANTERACAAIADHGTLQKLIGR